MPDIRSPQLILSIDLSGTDACCPRWGNGWVTVQVNVFENFPIFVVMLTAAAMALARLSI
ncbi:MAG TPA: hypothetical protein VFL49_01395 [Pseudolabrys sp.]|nr:hypothetical protein [Pseudolabrys sp.]